MGNFVIPKTPPSPTVPAGGAAGQILAKINDINFNTQWINNTDLVGFTLPTLTSGSVLFSNGTTIAQDNANFFWDDTNNRLGIGTATPNANLDVFGIASSAGGVNSNIGYNITPVVAPAAGMTATPVAGSGLNIGQYYYAITFYNALGETSAYFGISAVTTAGNQQVNLASIPISTNTTVIGRKIYRGKVGEGLSYGGLIATIANNTATTYSDTIPDSSVPGSGILDRAIYGKPNLSANYISVGGIRSLILDTNLTAFGIGAGNAITNAPNSTFIGYRAGYLVTSGSGNTLIGQTAGSSITGGFQNTIVGDTSGNGITTGSYNIGLGPNVLNSAAAGSFNIAAGYYTMNKGTGSYNILLGGYNWSSGTPTASYCTFIGGSLTNISAATNYQVNINDLITGISSGTKYVNILGSFGVGLAYGTAPAYPLVIGTNVGGTGSDFSVQTNSTAAKLTLSSQSAAMSFGASPQVAYTNGVPPGASFGSTSAGSRTTVGCLLTSAGGGTYVNFSTNGAASGFHITHNFGADLVTVLSNNNFGIGIAAPVAIFQVKTTTANTNSSIAFLNNNGIATIGTITDTGSALTMLQFRADGINFTDLGTNGIVIASTGYALSANATAILDVRSTTKGFLPPRMTTLQKIGITLPAAGLVIYDTNLNKLCVFTTAWETITSV